MASLTVLAPSLQEPATAEDPSFLMENRRIRARVVLRT